MGLRLTTLEGRFAVSRLPADAAVPRWAAGEVVAVTRTPDELSVICAEPAVPEATPAERGWRCLQVQGPPSFEMTGILAALSGPLADAHIPLLALSTYDTDYLLVREEHLEAAYAALERAGHQVDRATDHPGGEPRGPLTSPSWLRLSRRGRWPAAHAPSRLSHCSAATGHDDDGPRRAVRGTTSPPL